MGLRLRCVWVSMGRGRRQRLRMGRKGRDMWSYYTSKGLFFNKMEKTALGAR